MTAWHEGTAWHESMACLQPPPSLEEAILVGWCKLVEAQIGASTRPQLALVVTSCAWWEVVGRWVLQVLLREVSAIRILGRGLDSALVTSEHS